MCNHGDSSAPSTYYWCLASANNCGTWCPCALVRSSCLALACPLCAPGRLVGACHPLPLFSGCPLLLLILVGGATATDLGSSFQPSRLASSPCSLSLAPSLLSLFRALPRPFFPVPRVLRAPRGSVLSPCCFFFFAFPAPIGFRFWLCSPSSTRPRSVRLWFRVLSPSPLLHAGVLLLSLSILALS